MRQATTAYLCALLLLSAAAAHADAFTAAGKGRLPELTAYLNGGGDPNVTDAGGYTPLHYATIANQVEAVRLLLEHKAKVNVAKKDGVTPLHIAAAMGWTEIAKLLLAAGADPQAKDAKGRTPASLATEKGSREMLAAFTASHEPGTPSSAATVPGAATAAPPAAQPTAPAAEASGQGDRGLAEVKALLEPHPAKALALAEDLFASASQAGDLPRMLGIIDLLKGVSDGASHGKIDEWFCPALLYSMAETATPLAEKAGEWQKLIDLYLLRLGWSWQYRWFIFAIRDRGSFAAPLGLCWKVRRFCRAVDLAEAAATRAGATTPKLDALAELRQARASLTEYVRQTAPRRAQDLGPWYGAVSAIEDLAAEGEDTRATASMARLLADPALANGGNDAARVLQIATAMVELPGGARLASLLVPLCQRRGTEADCLDLFWVCGYSWYGRNDDYRRAILSTVSLPSSEAMGGKAELCWITIKRARTMEDRPLTTALCSRYRHDIDHTTGVAADLLRTFAFCLVDETTPAGVRQQVQLASCLAAPRAASVRGDGMYSLNCATSSPYVPPAEKAFALYQTATNWPKLEDQVEVLERAARLYESCDRPEAAAECRAAAKTVATRDPRVMLTCAVGRADALVAERRWQDAVSTLSPAVAAAPQPSAALVQAHLLLHQAYRQSGKAQEAAVALAAAIDALGKVDLPPVERANYWHALASLTSDDLQRLRCLMEANAAAQASGLGPLQDRVSTALAEAAVAADDLDAARTALRQTISRLEERRDALAYDRVLRQQWFADNLGPYQKLLRVEALRGDAVEALWVGEQMRGRALADQMAWQKVDLAVAVEPAVRQRLQQLREERRQTYALLQQALGAQAATDDTRGMYLPVRGMYLPVRGAYIPVRGPLEGSKTMTAGDLQRLRRSIDELAKEEAALASAVRESVPAYERASQLPVLTGRRIIEETTRQGDVVLVEYTLCDDGLVAVACGPNQQPQVVLIPIRGDDLWAQIGRFRQLIWERKPEAEAEAAKLYQLLVQPLEPSLGGAKRLWVVADGALQLLPFAALQAPDKTYLGARLAVATTPALSLSISHRERRPGQGTVVFAAPDTGAVALPGDDTRGAYLPVRGMYLPVRGAYLPLRGEEVGSALAAMALVPLPGAKAEGAALAAKLPQATLIGGEEATRARLLSAGSACDLLHIATHGYADPDVPEFSGLLLAKDGAQDGVGYDVLTALDIYMWPLQARLVTLSACQTAMGKTVEGEGLMGLTRAFIFAGAQDVLCTLWPVADESTKQLMVTFYDKLKPGVPVETALQQAQLALAGAEGTRDIFFWGGFMAVRGPQ